MTTARRWGRVAAGAALIGLLALGTAACGDDKKDDSSSSTTSSTASTSSSTSSSSTTTSTTAASSTTGGASTSAPATTGGNGTTPATGPGAETTAGLGALPEGPHYGYFKGIKMGKVEGQAVSIVGFDKVDLLTGQAAVDAAAAAGKTLDTDYYIRNENPLVRQLPVIPDSQVTVLDGGSANQVPSGIDEAVSKPGLYKIEVVVVRGVSLITAVEGVYLA
jgi:hypothetical protein